MAETGYFSFNASTKKPTNSVIPIIFALLSCFHSEKVKLIPDLKTYTTPELNTVLTPL